MGNGSKWWVGARRTGGETRAPGAGEGACGATQEVENGAMGVLVPPVMSLFLVSARTRA